MSFVYGYCDAVATGWTCAGFNTARIRTPSRLLNAVPTGARTCSARAPRDETAGLALRAGCPLKLNAPPLDAIDARTHTRLQQKPLPPPVRPAAQSTPEQKDSPRCRSSAPALASQGRAFLFVPDKEQNPSPPRETQSQKPKAIPGYRGFIRGSQHYYGLTDGGVSRRAPSTSA